MRTRPALAGLCVAIILGGTSAAQTAPDQRPRLLTAPSASDLNDHFPPVARATGLSGDVSLNCVVHLDEHADCTVLSETPAGMGFGDAALGMTANWRFAPAYSGGQPVADVSRVFRIRFANEETQSIPLSDGLVVTAQRGSPANVRVDADSQTIAVTGVRVPIPSPRPTAASGEEPTSAPLLSGDDFYPKTAHREGVAGIAIVACDVRSDGRQACGYEREFPEGFGFGEAAVGVATQAFQSPSQDQTQSGAVLRRFPVEFKFADPADDGAAATADPPSARPGVGRFFPRRALERGVSGAVMLVGAIRADGHVDCSVVDETPEGYQFAAAALAICRDFVTREDSLASQRYLVGDRIYIPITFTLVR